MPATDARVALLARPGVAADRLRDALAQAGTACVLDADPTSAGLSLLVDAAPDVVVVALDPAVEDVIERFEPVLGDPRVDVVYEEADIVAGRDGWDLARWQRHLVAKLQRHGDVLPPAPVGEDAAEEAAPESVALPDDAHASLAEIADAFAMTPDATVEAAMADAMAEATGHAIEGDALDALEGSTVLPEAALAADLGAAGLGARAAETNAFDPTRAEFDVDAPAAAVAPFVHDGHADAALAEEVEGLGLEARALDTAGAHAFDPAHAESLDWQAPGAGEDAFAFDPAQAEELTWQPPAAPEAETLDFEASFTGFDSPAPAPVAEAVPDFDITPMADAPAAAPRVSLGELSLADADAPMPHADAPGTRERFRHDLADLNARIATLELVDDTPRRGPEQARGAVLVLAGIGGPDAVRQLLGGLPAEFARPVLVQQRLDGGRYDKLVAQMQRATSMTVDLAEAGQPVIAGVVYILPDSIGVESQDTGLRFNTHPADLIGALPAADSAVLLFSGSDAGVVDAVMNHKWAGAFVAGQSPDGCYDASAPAALVARGADAGAPAELARQLVQRWS